MENENTAILRALEAGEFAGHNGRVVRALNILDGQYIALDTLRAALPDLDTGALHRSLRYLHKSGYIAARAVGGRDPLDIHDALRCRSELTLTKAGTDLALYITTDPAVRV